MKRHATAATLGALLLSLTGAARAAGLYQLQSSAIAAAGSLLSAGGYFAQTSASGWGAASSAPGGQGYTAESGFDASSEEPPAEPEPAAASLAVSFRSPPDGATVSGAVFALVGVPPNAGVSHADLYIDGALAATVYSAPYLFAWDSALVSNGTHTLTAKAYGTGTLMGQAAVVVKVANTGDDPVWSLSVSGSPSGTALGDTDAQRAQLVVPAGTVTAATVLKLSAERTSDPAAEAAKRQDESRRRLSRAGAAAGVAVLGPGLTQSASAAPPPSLTVRLAYDPAKVPSGATLGMYHWDAVGGRWQAVPGAWVDGSAHVVCAAVSSYQGGTYAVYAAAPLVASGAVPFGEVFAYPNPAARGRATIHLETAPADSLEVRIYSLGGSLVHQASVASAPIVGVNGKQAYEYVWDTGGAASGGYLYVVEAKSGGQTGRVTGKIAVIR